MIATALGRLSLATLCAGALVVCGGPLAQERPTGGRQASIEAFGQMANVLTHPRCQNCHTDTGYPRQGDDRHRHTMNVQRGNEGHGAIGQRCNSCHGRANNSASGVPGADEDWHLAPLSMGWENRSLADLCRGLKDPTRNGGRTGADIVAHLNTPLVRWAWDPGKTAEGVERTPPPISHVEFIESANRWLAGGAACPE